MRRSVAQGWAGLAMVAAGVGLFSTPAWGVNTFDPVSHVTFTFDPDQSVANDAAVGTFSAAAGFTNGPTKSIGSGTATPIPLVAQMPVPPAYQYKATYTKTGAGAGSSTATASVGQITNSTTLGLKLAAGTGITQTSSPTTGKFGGASDLRIDFNDLVWDINNNFGPPAQAFFSVALGGKVASAPGSFAEFIAHIQFTDGGFNSSVADVASDVALEPAIETFAGPFDVDKLYNTPGQSINDVIGFSQLLQDNFHEFSDGISSVNQLHISGYIEFRARDDDDTQLFTTFGQIGGTTDPNVAAQTADAPEPVSATLGAIGLGALALVTTRRRRNV